MGHNRTIIDEDKTFILAGYVITCSGTVVSWEFCYQISGTPSVTFYPGIWRIIRLRNNNKTNYKLVQSSKVTFDPNGTSNDNHLCKIVTLPNTEQFTAPPGSVIGLYSNKGAERPQLLITEVNSLVTTYQVDKNKSEINKVEPNDNQDVDYNIAIRVHIGKLRTWLCSSLYN